ncbi:MAG: HdeD family acid-resistance protein [Eubacteriales bacterium]
MKKKRIDFSEIVAGLFELLVGILLLINPLGFTKGIIILGGVVLCAVGIKYIVNYFYMNPFMAANSQALLKGLCSLLAGGFCIIKSNWFFSTFPILTAVFGVIILLFGLGKVQTTVDMIRLKFKKWFWSAISAAITLICSAVILMNPFDSTAFLWTFTGIALIVEAVLDIIIAIFGKSDNNGYNDMKEY